MPRTPRNPGPPSVYFAVFGLGEASLENITSLLDDYIENLGEVTPKFIIPVDKDLTTSTIQDVAAYAQNAGYAYEVVHVDAFGRTKALKAIGDAAGKVSKVESIEEAIIERLVAAKEDGILLFLWDEDSEGTPNEDDQRFLYQVFEDCTEVTVLELSGGLEEINPPDGDASAEDPDAEVGDADPEPAAEAGDDTTYEIASGWPVRKLRAWALDEEVHGEEALTSADTDKMSKEDLLDYFFPDDENQATDPEPEPEPEPEPAPRRTRATRGTPPTEAAGPLKGRARAQQVREDTEAETGQEVTTAAARRVRKAAAAAPAEESPVKRQRARDKGKADEALDRLAATREGADEAQADPTLEFVRLYANEIADIIIDRIAARVEAEPVDSAVRKEVAPPRPPGRPRSDGEAPTRRTVARSRR